MSVHANLYIEKIVELLCVKFGDVLPLRNVLCVVVSPIIPVVNIHQY